MMPSFIIFFLLVAVPRDNTAFGSVVSARTALLRDGYALIDDLLSEEECADLKKEFARLFSGDFDTKIYPDEWYPGQRKEDEGVKEIVNAWKSSDRIAAVALSPYLGRLACELMNWEGARLAQDDCVWKPPRNGGPVAFHTDAKYISNQFIPREENSITIWIAIDLADQTNGILEYARGSHLWPLSTSKHDVSQASFHGADANSYRKPALLAQEKNTTPVDFSSVSKVQPGSALVHHQDVFHGSSPNTHPSRHRRALVLHYIRHDVRFRTDPPPDYIYGRYILHSNPDFLFDDFFPLVYSNDSSHLVPTSAAYRRLARIRPPTSVSTQPRN